MVLWRAAAYVGSNTCRTLTLIISIAYLEPFKISESSCRLDVIVFCYSSLMVTLGCQFLNLIVVFGPSSIEVSFSILVGVLFNWGRLCILSSTCSLLRPRGHFYVSLICKACATIRDCGARRGMRESSCHSIRLSPINNNSPKRKVRYMVHLAVAQYISLLSLVRTADYSV